MMMMITILTIIIITIATMIILMTTLIIILMIERVPAKARCVWSKTELSRLQRCFGGLTGCPLMLSNDLLSEAVVNSCI